jgi:histidine ammonia-lyase
MPQVHGACRDAVAYAEWLLKLELNAVTDNPLIFISDAETGGHGDTVNSKFAQEAVDTNLQPPATADGTDMKIEVISGGNFHGEPLALAFDYLTIALSELGNISERRTMRLTDEASNAHVLPAFLTENGGLNSGFMIVQYTAASLCTENKVLSHPASVDTIPSSANVEDHVSMGATAALKLRQVAENLELILSIELLCAAQGIDFRKAKIGGEKRLGRGTRAVYEAIRSKVPFVEKDEYLKDYLDDVRDIISGTDFAL